MNDKTLSRVRSIFLNSVVVILAMTAGAKLFSATGSAGILSFPDPVSGVNNRLLLIVAAGVEMVIAVYLVFGRSFESKLLSIAWLSSNFALYRVALWWLNPQALCPCLGTVIDRLRVKPSTADIVLKLIIGYLLLGSLWFLTAACLKKGTATSLVTSGRPEAG